MFRDLMRSLVVLLPILVLLAIGVPRAEAEEEPVPAAWLGFDLSCKSVGETRESALLIQETILSGPAAAAGLAAGDIIQEVDGASVGCRQQLDALNLFGQLEAGQRVSLTVLQSGTPRVVELEAIKMSNDRQEKWAEQYRRARATGRRSVDAR